MDHNQAVDLQLAVKYVLGELPPVQRDEFEDHYIDCPECAKDVHAAAAFADTAREVFREEGRSEAPAPARERAGWFALFKPAFAMPAFAALLLFVVYQNAVTIPRAAAHGAGQVFTSFFSLQTANTRGGEEIKIRVHPNESFGLRFDFTPSKAFNSYLCELQDGSGRTLVRETLPGTSANQETVFAVREGVVKPGRYNLVFKGASDSISQGAREEVLRLSFSVEFLS